MTVVYHVVNIFLTTTFTTMLKQVKHWKSEIK